MPSKDILVALVAMTGAVFVASSGCNPPSASSSSGTGGSGAGGTSEKDAGFSPPPDGPTGTGGQSGAAGGSAVGGSGVASGGGSSTGMGGASVTGGTMTTGSMTTQGGAPGTGGAVETGGSSAPGGATGTAGVTGGMGGVGAGGTPTGDAASRDAGDGDVLVGDTRVAGSGGAITGGNTGTGGAGTGGNPGTGGATADPTRRITVWMAGDSTMMPPSGGVCPFGWGSQFQSLLNSNATVVDSAVGGRSIQTWLYDPNVTTTMAGNPAECVVSPQTYSSRWQAMLDPTTGMKPGDYLLVEFGINDGDKTCNRHVGTALFQTYLGVMAKAAKAAGAQPVFLTSTSYMLCTGSAVTPNRGFVAETKAAGAANDVPVIDLTALSAGLYTSLGLCPNSLDFTSTTSAVGKFFCDDHTHFEAAGAAQIAGVVAKALKDQGIGLAAYLK
jgi:lysophospholipase L1-like esterase